MPSLDQTMPVAGKRRRAFTETIDGVKDSTAFAIASESSFKTSAIILLLVEFWFARDGTETIPYAGLYCLKVSSHKYRSDSIPHSRRNSLDQWLGDVYL